MKPTIETYSDSTALVAAAGDRLVSAIASTIEEHGTASIVLTGGGTGIGLLERVRERAGEIDWAKVHIYWGDERFVPSDNDERNDKQAREALLDHIDIPPVNVHSMAASDGEFGDDLDAAAGGYEQLLAETFVDPATEFDIHLLGMGGEGHVNSLFPDSAAVRETERTLEELDEVAADTPLYRASGAIMVRVDDLKKLKSDLKEEQERLELRTKTLKTQIDKLNTQLQEMQTRLTPVLQRLQGPGGPGAGS